MKTLLFSCILDTEKIPLFNLLTIFNYLKDNENSSICRYPGYGGKTCTFSAHKPWPTPPTRGELLMFIYYCYMHNIQMELDVSPPYGSPPDVSPPDGAHPDDSPPGNFTPRTWSPTRLFTSRNVHHLDYSTSRIDHPPGWTVWQNSLINAKNSS